MKLEKLYTLSQFIDLVKSVKFNPDEGYSVDEFMVGNLGSIYRYDTFLKQPLKKEMFVFVPPFSLDFEHKTDDNSWSPDEIKAWQEAEKKVIFDKSQIELDSAGMWRNGFVSWFNTPLRIVAEKTNGELNLKNVNI